MRTFLVGRDSPRNRERVVGPLPVVVVGGVPQVNTQLAAEGTGIFAGISLITISVDVTSTSIPLNAPILTSIDGVHPLIDGEDIPGYIAPVPGGFVLLLWPQEPGAWPQDSDITAIRGSGVPFGAGTVTVSGVPTVVDGDVAVLRYDSAQAGLEELQALLDGLEGAFTAEAWDYSSVRILWNFPESAQEVFGPNPPISIVRSSQGVPTTPQDGVQVLPAGRRLYDQHPAIEVSQGTDPVGRTFIGQRTDWVGGEVVKIAEGGVIYDYSPAVAFHRPRTPGFYDGNLPSGRWYHYAMFVLYALDGEAGPTWNRVGDASVLIPGDHNHRSLLYETLPEWYREQDKLGRLGTVQEQGDLERFFQVIGWELDLVRTYLEGAGHISDPDLAPLALLKRLGEDNLGLPSEGGLGDANYRAVVSALSKMQRVRGTARGLQLLARMASKYDSAVYVGANLLPLTDDSEFVDGTGSWGFPTSDPVNGSWWGLDADGDPISVLGLPYSNDINRGVVLSTGPAGEDTPSRYDQALIIPASPTATAALLSCGAGNGYTVNRHHDLEPTSFSPYEHAVKVAPGRPYTFSLYIRREDSAVDNTSVRYRLGIVWFRKPQDPQRPGALLGLDYLGESAGDVVEATPGTGEATQRLLVEDKAPTNYPDIYAVPVLAIWTDSGGDNEAMEVERKVFCAMLNESTNTDSLQTTPETEPATPIPMLSTFTIGDPGSVLDSPTHVLGG